MDFILIPANPERQRALPEDPGACPASWPPWSVSPPEPGPWPAPGQAPYLGRARRRAPNPLHGHRVCGPAQPRHPCVLHASVRQGQAAGHAERHHAEPGAVAKRTCHKVAPYLTLSTVTGPGAAAHPAAAGPGATAGGGTHPARPLGIRGLEPRAAEGPGAQPALPPCRKLGRPRAQRTGPGRARPAQSHRGLVWALQASGTAGTGAEDRGGRPQLRAPDGRRHGLNRAQKTACRETADDGPPPISTRLKQCPTPQAPRMLGALHSRDRSSDPEPCP